MKTRTRVLATVLGCLSAFSYVNTATAQEIYDPTGLVSRHGELVTLA